jgi:hypothetical protein
LQSFLTLRHVGVNRRIGCMERCQMDLTKAGWVIARWGGRGALYRSIRIRKAPTTPCPKETPADRPCIRPSRTGWQESRRPPEGRRYLRERRLGRRPSYPSYIPKIGRSVSASRTSLTTTRR